MRMALWLSVWVAMLAAPSQAKPSDVLDRQEYGLEVTLNMPETSLQVLFKMLGRLSDRTFVLDPGVGELRMVMQLKNVPLRTALDVIARNHDLVYMEAPGGLRVARRPAPGEASGDGSYDIELAVSTRTREDAGLSVVRRLTRTVRLGSGACATVAGKGEPVLVREVHAELAAVEEKRRTAGPSVRLCVEKVHAGGLDLVGQLTMREVTEEGRRTVEERRLFQKTVGRKEVQVTLLEENAGSPGVMLVKLDGVAAK